MKPIYPLGHSAREVARLEMQAKLFHDPFLDELARKSRTCLEMGCGVGSNWSVLKNVNPSLQFTGVDISQTAVDSARGFHADATFDNMDVTRLGFTDQIFDLVFSKLVLWAVGAEFEESIREAHRVLKPGGTFYSFEPYDKGIVVEPPRPLFQSAFQDWSRKTVQNGLDPNVGPKVPMALVDAGFKDVKCRFFPILTLGTDPQRYNAQLDNFKNVYFGHTENHPAIEDLYRDPSRGLIMDSFFVAWGVR